MITEEPPAPAAWQDVLLGAIASGVDLAQIERQLALSPTERLDRMRKVLMALNEGLVAHDRGLRGPDSRAR